MKAFKHPFIQAAWQQVQVGPMGNRPTPTILMMTAERHLPSGKRNEKNASRLGKTTHVLQETDFVADVLDDIMADNHIEENFRHFHFKEVQRGERAVQTLLLETGFGNVGIAFEQIDADNITTAFGKWCQIAAHAASDFQNTNAFSQRAAHIFYVREEILLACFDQLVKILLLCNTPNRHFY